MARIFIPFVTSQNSKNEKENNFIEPSSCADTFRCYVSAYNITENNFIDAESVQWCESSVHLVCFILVCTSVLVY